MQVPAPATPTDQLFLTALPNGVSGNQLRLSLLITPALATDPLAYPFINWPDYAKNLKFSATFTDPTNNYALVSGPTPLIVDSASQTPPRDKSLWLEIFEGTSKVAPRKGHKKLHRSWRISHDITAIRNHNELNRLAHAYSQMAANRNVAAPDLFALQRQTTVPPLFLHPDFNSGTASDLPVRIDDRARAVTDLNTITQTLTQSGTPRLDFRTIVANRFKYAVDTLEKWGGARLSAASLSAVYLSCLGSATGAGISDPTLTAAAAQVNGWFAAGALEFQASYPEFPDIPDYLQLLLFHRRSTTKKLPGSVPPPNFHQLLGTVHNYPAIMRQLALVYDFVLPVPGITGAFAVSIGFNPATPKNLLPGDEIMHPVTVVSCNTLCTLGAGQFFATPKNPALIEDGLLDLRAPGANSPQRFSLVPENADSQALKATSQSNNQERGTQYATSAPTAYNAPTSPDQTVGELVLTPPASANPVTAPSAPRTVGLALFDRDRLLGLEQQAAKVPDSDSDQVTQPADFHAEDLILGYRVDILYNKKFYSLCQRTSTYDIYVPRQPADDAHKVDTWKPYTDMEKSADEGFTSFAATQSPMSDNAPVNDDTATQTQTQVHQVVFTWTGWSLSVPAPAFPQMNRNKGNLPQGDPGSNHLAIQPRYGVSPGQLPPLRFNTDYKVRCRIVDLAGNGPLPTLDPSNATYDSYTLAPFSQFSRHEPIRAPQFLLRKPIHRTSEPGTHIDRMVARDNNRDSTRMLAPPRESLRLAELSGYLTSPVLPDTAFSDLRLEIDGAFPTVARAKEQGWVPGKADNPHDNDPIFLRGPKHQEIMNRYYPDPLANFFRIQAFVVTDDPAISMALKPIWLKITNGTAWPQRLAARVRLIPTDRSIEPKIDVDQQATLERHFRHMVVPTLSVTLPKAGTVVLRISSAAVNHDDPPIEGRDYSVHLSHLVARHKNDPAAFDALLPAAQQSGGPSPTSVGAMLQKLGVSIDQNIDSPFNSPNVFVDGSLDIGTPKRSMTLVHAVKRPLDPPRFAPNGLQVTRAPGKPEAQVMGQLGAHWLSTAKITCYAVWSDRVDDLTLPIERKEPNPHHEVAFSITSKDLQPESQPVAERDPTRLRWLSSSIIHHFTDTRAHDVTYTLVASTNFREYYPEAKTQPDPHAGDYQINGAVSIQKTILSSARPLAPSIVYLIPAFVWADTYDHVKKVWYQGRTVVLRAYFKRPFLLSGDRETVAAVFVDSQSATPAASQNFVSRWGADPTREITAPILQNELSEANFNEPGAPPQTAILAEGGTARFKPCTIQYSPERQLWFSDIPINTQNANSPFVRLALARWQPDALSGTATNEARCSQVVFAEFMQISTDRWVSLQKKTGSFYYVAISGAFPSKNPQNPFNITLQKRWYALGKDTGWRTISWSPKFPPPHFDYHPATDGSGVSCWSTELHTPHSAYVAKYRVLLTEEEFAGQDARKSFSALIDLP